eukprot:scaffold89986_cov14-Tisochrysis_lutea.AAC.1
MPASRPPLRGIGEVSWGQERGPASSLESSLSGAAAWCLWACFSAPSCRFGFLSNKRLKKLI